MAKNTTIHKILVIGSGPIVIGQAAEFDYSGTQACLSLKAEGYEVILVNSNPATIMTDQEIADKVFIEPLTKDFVSRILFEEKPDAILPTLGGQTGLNLAKELADSGILEQLNIQLLGTQLSAIEQAEDRELFKELMNEIGEPIPSSGIANTYEEATTLAQEIGFPLVVRPAYTMGGAGGGFVHEQAEFDSIVRTGLKQSPVHQVLIEKSIAGYKEIEFEVMRDAKDNALIVASMENIDPVGIHTGDSIVVSPTQTLSDRDFQMMRDAALKIIRALKIEGGCNVQMALDPNSSNYYIIEVNPRVSRSSAFASKATGYPIAETAAKIAVGLQLDEIKNPITGKTWADFEPALDYVVTKIPRWPFDKFTTANRQLGTQMKATGEVMALGRNFEESFQKACRSLENGEEILNNVGMQELSTDALVNKVKVAEDDRLFAMVELLSRGQSVQSLAELTDINTFFLYKLAHIVQIAADLQDNQSNDILQIAKENGFSDKQIAKIWQIETKKVTKQRQAADIHPVYKMVDTAAGEFESKTPYYYSTYDQVNESQAATDPAVLVIGSGPIRIGQGVEFDYSTVHAIQTIQNSGYKAIVMNSNPETVSTDFAISDKLYFEPLTLEDVLNVVALEQPIGVVVQFGGQTAINLAEGLQEAGVKILGTSVENINRSEDRDLFNQVVQKLQLPQPKGATATTIPAALKIAEELGYPVLVRPSYVLGGQAMEIVHSQAELNDYMSRAVKISNDHPVLIDSYLAGQEAEVDIISDGQTVVIPGILEHIEPAGVHSGDSMSVYPPQRLTDEVQKQMVDDALKLGKELGIIGLMNIQFIIHQNKAYVIEVNPRSSRTVPFLSKVTSVPMAELATKAVLGISLKSQGYTDGLLPEKELISVKTPIFSFAKLPGVDPLLSPEMKSTGETLSTDATYPKALQKAFLSAGIHLPHYGQILFSVKEKDETAVKKLTERFEALGYQVVEEAPVEDNLFVLSNKPTDTILRQESITKGIPLFTDLGTVEALLTSLENAAFCLRALE